MEKQSAPDAQSHPAPEPAGGPKTFAACVAGYFVPGLGHALLGKWDRAAVFFFSITIMAALGIRLEGRLVGPEFQGIFSTLKFIAEAGNGLIYWVSLTLGLGVGDPKAYTFDYANVFLYVAGLLNMLVVVDAFDIALGRKR